MSENAGQASIVVCTWLTTLPSASLLQARVNERLTNVKNILTEEERERQSLYTSEHSLKKYASNKLEFVSTVKEQLNKLRRVSESVCRLERHFNCSPKKVSSSAKKLIT